MEIKYYYEAKSQNELDYLLEYCVKAGFDNNPSNYSMDYSLGCNLIGIAMAGGTVMRTSKHHFLQGELTTDIETFKAQFKTERTIKDIEREVEALEKEKAELEAAQPLSISESNDNSYWCEGADAIIMVLEDNCYDIKAGRGIWINHGIDKLKLHAQDDGSTILTLHK